MHDRTTAQRGLMALALAALVALPAMASADVDETIRIQGRLMTNGGQPAPDGDYGLTFYFYKGKADEKALFSHVDAGVKVASGMFATTIGAKTQLPSKHFFGGQVGWLGIQVGSEKELPRLRVNQVPYALRAAQATDLQCTGCVKASHLDSKLLAVYAKSAELHAVAKSGSYKDLKNLPVHANAAQKCGPGKFATEIDQAGKLVCLDVKQVSYSGADFALSNKKCGSGKLLSGIDAKGLPICITDKNNTYTAGTGLLLSKGVFSANTNWADARYVNEKQGNAINSAMIANGQVGNADLAANAVTSDKIKDGAVGAQDIGIKCGQGEVLSQSSGKWVCTAFGSLANPSANMVVNSTLVDQVGNKVPDQHALSSKAGDHKYSQLGYADLHNALGGTGAQYNPAMYAVDIRSSGAKGYDESLTIAHRLDAKSDMDVLVTCSIYVRRPDSIGTNATAKLECFGASSTLKLPKSDLKWHRMKVTTRVRWASKAPTTMKVYGSGFKTGGDAAFVRYALPKLEYGTALTAWNASTNGLPRGMIAFFPGKCPPGWVEYTALRGRVVMANPNGGKVGQSRGSALGTNGARVITTTPKHAHSVNPPSTNSSSHSGHYHAVDPPKTTASTHSGHAHGVNPPNTGTTSQGGHYHKVDPPNTNSSTGGNHYHGVNPPGTYSTYAGNHYHGVNTRQDDWNVSGGSGPSWGADNGTYKVYHNTNSAGNHRHHTDIGNFNSATTGNHYHATNIGAFNSSSVGNHAHTVNIGNFNSATAGGHNHTTDIGKFNSAAAGGHNHATNISPFNSAATGASSVEVTMPYLQLTACMAN